MTKDERRRHKIRQNSARRFRNSNRARKQQLSEIDSDGFMSFVKRGELRTPILPLVRVEIDEVVIY